MWKIFWNKPLVLLFFSILLLNTISAQELQPVSAEKQDAIAEQIKAATQNITSIQADFTQEKVFSFLENSLKSTGTFRFQSPDKIRWEYTKPYPYLIILNEGKMHVKDEGDSYTMDMRSNQLFQQMNSLITKSIQGELLQEEAYKKTFFENDKNYMVHFEPKDTQLQDYLSAIEIYFSKENGQVTALKMKEAAGDYTYIVFNNRIENKPINPELFRP